MYIIVGLGNPGKTYERTRHNVGFLVVNEIAEQQSVMFRKGKGPYEYCSYVESDHRVILVKPLTFMNLSGMAVQSVMAYFKLDDLDRLLIVLDDINLPFGTIRLRPMGSHGGQKGLKSIIKHLGTSGFPRLRIGISDHFTDAADYVLSSFNKSELRDLPQIIEWSSDAVRSFISNGVELTMSRYNKSILSP